MNDTLIAVVQIVFGFVALIAGGESLVRGASALAAALRLSPLVIGLTVVAFGTSAPELAVSIQAALAGNADLAVGNVVGSNIFNVLFILGASAMIVPLIVSSQLIRRDVPLMIGASVLLLILGWDGSLHRLEGLLLFAGIVTYTWWCIRESRKESIGIQTEFAQEWPPTKNKPRAFQGHALLIIVGLVLLGVGSRWLVAGAVFVAARLGVSELVIGLTIIAVGTSLPEVVTSIVAACRGERDIAVGNVVGSNLFNILCVLGVSSLIAPNSVAVSLAALRFDIPVMIAVAVACLPIFFTGNVIARWEGGVFFFYYVVYTAYLVLSTTGHEFSHMLRDVMIVFVIPLTIITLAVTVWRSFGQRRSSHQTADSIVASASDE